MSQAQVQKLHSLLARVQQRRQEPRLVAVGGVAAPSANTNLAAQAPSLELAKPFEPKRPSIEDAIAPTTPSSLPPPAAPSSIPPPAAPSSIPPPSQRTPAPARPATSTVPPPEVLARAPTEVLPAAEVPPAAGVRVAATPALPFDSAVRVTSSPRIEAPKSFGDLLELSLALRPKAG